MEVKYFLVIISILIIFILSRIYLLIINKNPEHFTSPPHPPYDKTFIINLNETPEGVRRWSVIKNMNQFYNKERFPAIYGKTYDYSNEINKKIITESWDYGKWKHGKSQMIPFDKGEIGVGLSHYYIWKRVSDDPSLNTVLILEDDAVNIHPQFINIVNEISTILVVTTISFY
jgi:GR25 family glycosyltransferase involved in LPS biosynthesis